MDGAQFTALRQRVNASTLSTVLRIWASLDAWRDADAARFALAAVPVVQAGQTTVAQLTAAYIADEASAAHNTTIPPPVIPAREVTNGRQVTPTEVYRRPFVEVYTALAGGKALADAVGIGRSRLDEITDLDLQRAYSLAAQQAMDRLPEQYQPRRWRRVTVGQSCALCVVASTQRYKRSHLNPIHRACDCRVVPDYSGQIGQAFDDNLLERTHAAVKELTGQFDPGARTPDYRQLIVDMTAEHGELGPLLVRPRDQFTGPLAI